MSYPQLTDVKEVTVTSRVLKSFATIRLTLLEGRRVKLEVLESQFADEGQSWIAPLAHGGSRYLHSVSKVRLYVTCTSNRYPYSETWTESLQEAGDVFTWVAPRVHSNFPFVFDLRVDVENHDPYSYSQITTDVLVSDEVKAVYCQL